MAHDFRSKADKGVELIVRPKNKYGIAMAGEIVIVDKEEMQNPSTRAACMTRAEAKSLSDKVKKDRAAAEEAKRSKRSIMNMIDSGLDRVSKAGIASAKKKAESEARESDEIIRKAEAAEAAE